MLNSDKETAEKRLSICKNCDKYGKMVPKVCGACACIMPIKVKLKSATCPMGKW